MKIFEKIDTVRHRRDINLCRPVSQPDATGFSGAEPEAMEPIRSASIKDYSAELGKSVTPTLADGPRPPRYRKKPTSNW